MADISLKTKEIGIIEMQKLVDTYNTFIFNLSSEYNAISIHDNEARYTVLTVGGQETCPMTNTEVLYFVKGMLFLKRGF